MSAAGSRNTGKNLHLLLVDTWPDNFLKAKLEGSFEMLP
jgi:hypothetical protein